VIGGLVAGQLVALAAILVAGDTDLVMAAGFVLADLVLVGIVVGSAARGAERLTAATLGVRRTRFWRAVGWTLAIWVGVTALEALWAVLVGGFSNVEEDAGITDGELIVLLFAIAVVAPIAEELAFRGYLFPALTRWRGPWIGALLTALLPCVALHAGNNAMVMSIGGDWTWQVPAAMLACMTLSILLLLPFAREREPYAAA
jgi:membrane protease YdiL (CAAX protease family)